MAFRSKYDPIYALIGARIAGRREAAGKTQAQCARALDMSQSAYSRLERGEIQIRLHQLVRLCQLLNLRAQTLFP